MNWKHSPTIFRIFWQIVVFGKNYGIVEMAKRNKKMVETTLFMH
jgi:hypothetical protein